MLEIRAETASSFRDIVAGLDCSPSRIIDVGAGGFAGETTTVHLVELFPDAEIVAVELVPEKAEAVRERFGDRVEVVASDIRNYAPSRPFDLTIVDLDPYLLHVRLRAPFDNLFPPLTAAGGVIVSDILLDVDKSQRSQDDAAELREFMEQHFGTARLTGDVIAEKFRQPRLKPIALVEKWRGDSANFMGWIAFRRR